MFGSQTMATQLLPGIWQCNFNPYTLVCYFYLHTPGPCHATCPYGYVTHLCHNYNTCILGYHSIPPNACPFGTNPCLISQNPCLFSQDPLGQGGIGGDPVQVLQVLRQQLEVTLAGVRAQEEELQRQRAATGGEGGQQGRGGRAARTPRSE